MTVRHDSPIATHLGFAVHDVFSFGQKYEQFLGARFRVLPDMTVKNGRGEPAKLRVAYGAVPGMVIELIQVVEGDTPHSDFIQAHGEGLQHIGYWVEDTAKAAVEMMKQGGALKWFFPMTAEGSVAALAAPDTATIGDFIPSFGLAYIDPHEGLSAGGTVIELMGPPIAAGWFAPGAERPYRDVGAPDVTYQLGGGVLTGMEELVKARWPSFPE